MLESDQNKIIEKITKEILLEIENSNEIFTSDEIKYKIESKIDDFFQQNSSNNNESKEEYENETFIRNEFICINEDEDFLDYKELSLQDEISDHEIKCYENENNFNNLSDNLPSNQETTEKKKFIQDFVELYKDELNSSMESFKNVFESMNLMKKTSFIEKILIFLFLALPAIIGGIITFAFILIILILWQLHILIKVFTKIFDRIDSKLSNFIIKIKRKIVNLKNSGGFFNRLIFSNSLYSVLMFNGILYMLIKGMLLPLKSTAEIDKILANIVAKGVKGINRVFRGPSELALSNLRSNVKGNNLKSSRGNSKNLTESKNKLKLKNLSKAKQKLALKNINLKRAGQNINKLTIKNNIQKNIAKKLEEKTIKNINKSAIEEKLKEQVGNNKKSSTGPTSNMLSSTEINKMNKINLGQEIFKNVLENLTKGISSSIDSQNPFSSSSGSKNDNREATINSDMTKITNKIKEEEIKADLEFKASEQKITEITGGKQRDEVISEYSGKRCEMGENCPNVLSTMFNEPEYQNLPHDQKVSLAIEIANNRDSDESKRDIEHFNTWKESNSQATYEDFLQEKFEESKRDLNKETAEFSERYSINGEPADCDKLIGEAMKEIGVPKRQIMSSADFVKVAEIVSEKFPEEQRYDVIKDLKEHSLTYADRQNCREELKIEQGKHCFETKNTFSSREESRSGSHRSAQLSI